MLQNIFLICLIVAVPPTFQRLLWQCHQKKEDSLVISFVSTLLVSDKHTGSNIWSQCELHGLEREEPEGLGLGEQGMDKGNTKAWEKMEECSQKLKTGILGYLLGYLGRSWGLGGEGQAGPQENVSWRA